MTKDEFESILWRLAPGLAADRVTAAQAMNKILNAADAYAVATYGITAARRRVLAGITAPQEPDRLHYLNDDLEPACNMTGASISTSHPDDVTCKRCKGTRAWRNEHDYRETATTGGTR